MVLVAFCLSISTQVDILVHIPLDNGYNVDTSYMFGIKTILLVPLCCPIYIMLHADTSKETLLVHPIGGFKGFKIIV